MNSVKFHSSPKKYIKPSSSYHTILHIKSLSKPKKKMNKLLQYLPPKQKTTNQFCKDKSRIRHTLTLTGPFDTKKLLPTLRHLKSLKCLNIDLDWLPETHQSMFRFFGSLNHLKNLKMINFYSITGSVMFINEKVKILRKAIRKEIRGFYHLEVKLTLSTYALIRNEDGFKLLRVFCQLENLTSVDLTFLFDRDLSRVQDLLRTLKDCEALTKISLTLDTCGQIFPLAQFNNPLLILGDIKSLKNAKICFRKCSHLGPKGLDAFLPILKQIVKSVDVSIVFDACFLHDLYLYHWCKFVWSTWKFRASHKIRTKLIGRTKSATLQILLFIFMLLVGFSIPIIILVVTALND